MHWIIRSAMLVLVIGCAESLSPKPEQQSSNFISTDHALSNNGEGRAEPILFVVNRGGTDQDLASILPDGSDLRTLTANAGLDISPRWSPARTRIAYASEQWGGSGTELFVANADGTNPVQLTHGMFAVYGISWSPDGLKLAFESSGGSFDPANLDVYTVNVDGTGLQNLTNRPGFDGAPDWSPLGNEMLFISSRSGPTGLFVMKVDGTQVAQLPTQGEVTGASWSPDGEQIAFGAIQGNSDIWIMRRDGKLRTRVTSDPADDRAPSWSPFGRTIAFQSDRTGRWEIFAVKANGTHLQQVTSFTFESYGPSWR